jgi:hypothetical protein
LRHGPADQERHDRKEAAHTPFLVFVRCEGSTISLFVDHNTDVADLKADLKVGPATRLPPHLVTPASIQALQYFMLPVLFTITLQACQQSISY